MPPDSIFLNVGQIPIAAGVKKKGCKGWGFSETLDMTNKNSMVASGIRCGVGNFKSRAAITKNRCAPLPWLPRQTDKTIDRPSGEAIGNILLIDGQNINRVMAGPTKSFKVVRGIIQAPQHKRRRQGNSRERIDSQPDRMPIRINSRDDGDAGGKASKGVTQVAAISLGLSHRGLIYVKRPYYRRSHS